MPNVDIPGVGVVAFPDTMQADAIGAAAKKLHESAMQALAPQEPGLQDPGLLDPLNYVGPGTFVKPIANLTGSAVRTGIQDALLGAAREGVGSKIARTVIPQAGSAAGRALGAGALEMGLEALPPYVRVPARMAMAALRGAAKEAPAVAERGAQAEAAPVAGSVAARAKTLAEIRPLEANATPDARFAHQVELEQALADAKIPEAAKRRILAAAGHEVPPTGRVVGKIVPGPAGPVATPEPGTVAARAAQAEAGAAEQAAKKASDAGKALAEHRHNMTRLPGSPRHEVQYFDKAANNYINIETIPTKDLPAKINEMANSRGTVGKKILESLRKELAYRMETGAGNIERKGKLVRDLNQLHIEQAIRKLGNPRPGDPNWPEYQALLEESLRREGTTGIDIGQGAQ